MTGYEIVPYKPEHRPQVLELQTHLWSPDIDRNDAYLRWKYEDNPSTDSPLIFLALFHGNVVGMRGAFGVPWVAGNPPQSIAALCVGDLVVAPAHRGRLLFYPIMETAVRELAAGGYRYLLSMSGSAVTHKLSMLVGFQKIGEYSMLQTRGNPARNLPRGFLSLEPEPRPREMADLVHHIGSDGRIRVSRDSAWFAWRFRNPLSDYRFLYAESNGALDGYLVLQHSGKRPEEGLRIMDWEFTDSAAGDALLREARIGLLHHRGFTPYTPADGHRRGPLLIALPGTNIESPIAGRSPLDLADWELRMSDSDSY
jgi:hypothetical protein